MLLSLNIKNYAIIHHLQVDFDRGFNVITGETGAGKSIIIGALGLILGQRAEGTTLRNPDEKCVVEGRFQCELTPGLSAFFAENDLDPDIPVILRREIAPGGKSRAFVNDTPVPLTVMRELGLRLIDIHSQHANLELGRRNFQLKVIDWYGMLDPMVLDYQKDYSHLLQLETEYRNLSGKAGQEKADYDYHLFQFKQLEEARLKDGEQETLEKEQDMLLHAGEINEGLAQTVQILDGDEFSLIGKIREINQLFNKLRPFLAEAGPLHQRSESLYYELRDIADECTRLNELCEHNPERLVEVSNRLDTLYLLEQKHRVSTVAELIALRDQLDRKIRSVESYDEQMNELSSRIEEQKRKALKAAGQLRKARLQQLKPFEKEVTGYLTGLGMPRATFSVDLPETGALSANGSDEAIFLFSANKGGKPEEISKVASGGEMSRLMLAIKTVVARSKALPAIIFDEIDTGISGEIAIKMAEILRQMSESMQVINITHLPQIAARGEQHFMVYKTDLSQGTETGIRRLDEAERIHELAKMLSGDQPSPAAVENARTLMGL